MGYPQVGPIGSQNEALKRQRQWIDYIKNHIQPAIDTYSYNCGFTAKLEVVPWNNRSKYCCDNPYGFITLDKDTGRLRGFSMTRFKEELYFLSKKQSLTREQALERAKQYLAKLIPDYEKMGVRFSSDKEDLFFMGGANFGAGWSVTAYRWVDGLKTKEAVLIEFEEDIGLLFFANGVFMKPTFTESTVSKEEAVGTARSFADVILANAASPGWQNWGRDFKIANFDGAELQIVSPNNLHEPGVSMQTHRIFLENHLAWVVQYKAKHEGESGIAPIYIRVYVDAGTGKVIGGGF